MVEPYISLDKGDITAKFWLNDVLLVDKKGYSQKESKKILG